MGQASEHIAAWEAAGLIDAATAERLRAAAAASGETAPATSAPDGVATEPPSASPSSQAAAMFGPSVTIPEVFGYLGTAFLLAGWTAFVIRSRLGLEYTSLGPGIGGAITAIALVALGLVLRRGDARRSRSAGVAFLVAVGYAGGGGSALAGAAGLDAPQAGVIGAGVALALAIGLRGIHPAVLTQVGLLGAITGLAAAIMGWASSVLVPIDRFSDDGRLIPGGPNPIVLVLASATWWLGCAFLIGLIGLLEARSADRGDAAAARRAAISRLWAGMVAVIGLATAVTRSAYELGGSSYVRVLKPWMGELALVLLSLVLLERAFRRDATAYVYAAALGLILALSDFNFTYLSRSTELGLVIEGVILLGVGLAADRLRRRIGHTDLDSQAGAIITDFDATSPAVGSSMAEATALPPEPQSVELPAESTAKPDAGLPPPTKPQSGPGR